MAENLIPMQQKVNDLNVRLDTIAAKVKYGVRLTRLLRAGAKDLTGRGYPVELTGDPDEDYAAILAAFGQFCIEHDWSKEDGQPPRPRHLSVVE